MTSGHVKLRAQRTAVPTPRVAGNKASIQVRYRGASATLIVSVSELMTAATGTLRVHCDQSVEMRFANRAWGIAKIATLSNAALNLMARYNGVRRRRFRALSSNLVNDDFSTPVRCSRRRHAAERQIATTTSTSHGSHTAVRSIGLAIHAMAAASRHSRRLRVAELNFYRVAEDNVTP